MKRTTQGFSHLLLTLTLLLSMVGCSGKEPTQTNRSDTAPTTLTIADLKEILSALDASNSTLTYCNGENEETHPANAAIRTKKYIKELQDYDVWETCQPPESWNPSGEYYYKFHGDGISLISYQSGFTGLQPLHVTTDTGDGWFRLSDIPAEQDNSAQQFGWMVYDTFGKWYSEARTADLYRSTSPPLTADELDELEAYTACQVSTYIEEWGGYTVSPTPISCFFTSLYDDPRDMDANTFITYCPSLKVLDSDDEDEFRLVQKKINFRATDGHLLTLEEMPTPCHRLPRSYINDILMQYAGITIEDMHSDWKSNLCYVPETDCFYTFTSDFGPGAFNPSYGEKSGAIVTLWGASSCNEGPAVLTLQKNGNGWLIRSFQAI
jgi:hypothetical protein